MHHILYQAPDDPFGEEAEKDGDDEEGEDFRAGGDTKTQQTASSSAASKYHVVHVTKKTHILGSDEFVFKDTKGKKRYTKRKDWQEIAYQGQPAWKYRHYISFDIFK